MISKDSGLNGLVLAGGRSLRMGTDKTTIQWHGKEQRYYMADMLSLFCGSVFISCRTEQAAGIDKNYNSLPDTYTGLGPYGGILTALTTYPEKAWLVVASDLPLLDEKTLSYLIAHRDKNVIATTFKSPHDGLPEPLITIWEAQSRSVLLSFSEQGYSCPRKVLIKNEDNVRLLQPPDAAALTNANTPADAAYVKTLIP